jgi:protein-S-isoprenylcysteine O-methyltransferase Ste14
MAAHSGPPRPQPPAGRDPGDAVLVLFTLATLIMVVAAVLVGAVGETWVLAPVMVVHLCVTFAVIAAIARLLDDGGR